MGINLGRLAQGEGHYWYSNISVLGLACRGTEDSWLEVRVGRKSENTCTGGDQLVREKRKLKILERIEKSYFSLF